VLLADSVGLALLVVIEMLPPAERLAFVLHDMFAVPFDKIAPILGRSAPAARQLASRARRRVQGAAPPPDGDVAANAKSSTPSSPRRAPGTLGRHPWRAGRGPPGAQVRRPCPAGAAGVGQRRSRLSVMGFTVTDDKIVAIDALGDPERLSRLDLSEIDGW
jgi:hypothetical protein